MVNDAGYRRSGDCMTSVDTFLDKPRDNRWRLDLVGKCQIFGVLPPLPSAKHITGNPGQLET
jgi:hypothetical protein